MSARMRMAVVKRFVNVRGQESGNASGNGTIRLDYVNGMF